MPVSCELVRCIWGKWHGAERQWRSYEFNGFPLCPLHARKSAEHFSATQTKAIANQPEKNQNKHLSTAATTRKVYTTRWLKLMSFDSRCHSSRWHIRRLIETRRRKYSFAAALFGHRKMANCDYNDITWSHILIESWKFSRFCYYIIRVRSGPYNARNSLHCVKLVRAAQRSNREPRRHEASADGDRYEARSVANAGKSNKTGIGLAYSCKYKFRCCLLEWTTLILFQTTWLLIRSTVCIGGKMSDFLCLCVCSFDCAQCACSVHKVNRRYPIRRSM